MSILGPKIGVSRLGFFLRKGKLVPMVWSWVGIHSMGGGSGGHRKYFSLWEVRFWVIPLEWTFLVLANQSRQTVPILAHVSWDKEQEVGLCLALSGDPGKRGKKAYFALSWFIIVKKWGFKRGSSRVYNSQKRPLDVGQLKRSQLKKHSHTGTAWSNPLSRESKE